MATHRTGIAVIDALLAEAPETIDTHGNRSRKIFYHADRYLFDFKIDLSRWVQLDTTSDAWYFGIWVNKGKRQVLKYIEGDIYFIEADSDEAYDAEIEALCRFHEPAPAAIAIDEMSETRFFQNRAELFIDPARAAACGADRLPTAADTEES